MELSECIAAMEEFMDAIVSKEVPKQFSAVAEKAVKRGPGYQHFAKKYGHDPRSFAHKHMMWTIADLAWTKQLANSIGELRVLEVMSGAGWLAKALRHHGVNVVATDNMEWFKERSTRAQGPVTEVESLGAVEAVQKHGLSADILLMCWPDSSVDAMAASAWGPEKPVYYIGERPGGCTGSERFFAGFMPEKRFTTPRFDGNWDALFVGHFDPAAAQAPLDLDDMGYARFSNWQRPIENCTYCSD